MRDFSVGNLITSYRSRSGLKQIEVANPNDPERLSVTLRTYQGWENGERIPSNQWLHRIASFFHLTEAEADELYRAAAQVAPEVHNLSFPRNPFFTGRKVYIEQLDQYFKKSDSVVIAQPISIIGLAGIGKTQLALEYAHRCYPKVYRTILWVEAANKITLETSYLSLAHLLKLTEKDNREVDRIIQAVKTWLDTHTNWLLIFDNADDLQLTRTFLPTKPRGHILLTTRTQIQGNIAARIEMEAIEPEEGLLFLLKRSGVLKDGSEPNTLPSDVHSTASQLVKLLGGHPLALDQAGAYIEETGDSFATYLQLYADQRLTLLNERGYLGGEHPETVATSLEISFLRACQMQPLAAEVLYFCSFLHPNDIPKEFFDQDNILKLESISFNRAIAALRHYSLISRNSKGDALRVHSLVQTVLKEKMDQQTRYQWAERVAQAVSCAFPSVNFTKWQLCQRYLPHVQICRANIEQWELASPYAIKLLSQAGYYLWDRALYEDAELFYKQALIIRERTLDARHPDIAGNLNNLARIYHNLERYSEAELLYQRAMSIWEQLPEPNYSTVISTLENYADLLRKTDQKMKLTKLEMQIQTIKYAQEHLLQ